MKVSTLLSVTLSLLLFVVSAFAQTTTVADPAATILSVTDSASSSVPAVAPVLPHERGYSSPEGYTTVSVLQMKSLASYYFIDAQGRNILIRLNLQDGKGTFQHVYGGSSYRGTWEVLEKDHKGVSLEGRFNIKYEDDKQPRTRMMIVDKGGDWFVYDPRQKDPSKNFLKITSKSFK